MVRSAEGRGHPIPRRTILRGLGTAFGAAVVAGVPGRADAIVADEALGDSALVTARLAVVERVNGSSITARIESSDELVELPARDFPVDWDFQVGSRVAVIDAPEEDTPVILPFVVTTDPARPELVANNRVAFGNIEGEVTNRSVRARILEIIRNLDPRHPKVYHGLFVENSLTDRLTAFGLIEH